MVREEKGNGKRALVMAMGRQLGRSERGGERRGAGEEEGGSWS